MILDYGTLLSPEPIKLSVGTLKKPTLREIASITFDKFGLYKTLMKLEPHDYYTIFLGEEGTKQWESFSEEKKDSLTIYEVICQDEKLAMTYCDMFCFFFIENVIFRENLFIILNDGVSAEDELKQENVKGIISEKTFNQAIDILQQICCIYEKKEEDDEVKFKSELAKRMYERMLKAKKEQERLKAKQANKDFSIPNIISAVSNNHQSINPVNVWELTVFQLLDSFHRLQINALYDINWTRVAVWGDEKKTFDASLWYKNNQE